MLLSFRRIIWLKEANLHSLVKSQKMMSWLGLTRINK